MMTTQLGRAMTVAACAAIASSLVHAQGRGGVEWTTGSYDAQRTASIKNDPRISVQTMQKAGDFGAFKFLWKLKLEYDPKAATALTQPILLDRIIGFRGFKSIAFVGTQSETVHGVRPVEKRGWRITGRRAADTAPFSGGIMSRRFALRNAIVVSIHRKTPD